MHVNDELWGSDREEGIYSALGEANGFDPLRVEAAPPAVAPVDVVTVVERVVDRPEGPQALTHTDRVRTGQRLENLHGDLVVIGDVNNGAELVASGNIHVYGRFAGRAMAGHGGHRTAKVFCSNFQGELVSIGGHFTLFEDVPVPLLSKGVVFSLNPALEIIEPQIF